jgi:hypothetical protein
MTEKAEDQELAKEVKESEKSTTYFTVTPGCTFHFIGKKIENNKFARYLREN